MQANTPYIHADMHVSKQRPTCHAGINMHVEITYKTLTPDE